MAGQIINRGKNKWVVRIYCGSDASGKRTYVNKTIKGTKKDAQTYLNGKLREKDLGIFISNSQITLDEHLDKWLKNIKSSIAEQTYYGYESLLKTHVRPKLGQVKLSNLSIPDIQSVYDQMQTKGLSSRTVRYAHTVLSMALKQAILMNYIVKNPCSFAKLPKHKSKERKAFSPEQANKFLKSAKDNKHGLVLEFAIVSGMRPEEYLSLRWEDVDFTNSRVIVRRALVWKKGGGFSFGEPKTKKSRRSIPIPKELLRKLKSHRTKQLEYRLKLGQAYSNLDLVFPADTGNPLNYRNLTQRYYVKILEDIGLDNEGFVLYSLRHTCATLLLARGENPKVVSERLGHSSVKMTLDVYSHVLPDMQQGASDKLESLLYG